MNVVFIDTETTGIDKSKDRVVEFAMIQVDYETLEPINNINFLVNPEMPIPKEASDIHEITDILVASSHNFSHFAPLIQEWLSGDDLVIGGQNVEFDIQILNRQLIESGHKGISVNVKTIDTLLIEKLVNSHRLEAMYKRYTGKELVNAHSATVDIVACIAVLQKQRLLLPSFNCISDLSSVVKEKLGYDEFIWLDHQHCFYLADDNTVKFAFGKHKGQVAKDKPDYLLWILNNQFNPDTKAVAMKLLESP